MFFKLRLNPCGTQENGGGREREREENVLQQGEERDEKREEGREAIIRRQLI